MQSDDFFFRKFKRSNPRPLLTAVTFEPKAARPAPEPAGTTVRARILEWPPQKEMPEDGRVEGRGGEGPRTQAAAAGGLGREEVVEQEQEQEEEEEEGEGGKEGRSVLPPIQRSNSEAAIAESAASPAACGPALHREYGSASLVERTRGPEGEGEGGEGERGGERAESPAAPRFQDPYLLLGLPETPGPQAPSQACRRAQKAEGPRSPGPDDPPWRRPRSLAHYDVQSLLFDPRRAASSRDSAGRRRNMVTGASAASQAPGPSKAEEPPAGGGEGPVERAALVLSCPHFRNEVGGEGERQRSSQCPNAAVSVLEEPRESQLTRTGVYFIEHADLGANYYRKYFSGKEHQNFFGIDESLGPVAVSLRREEKDKDSGSSSQHNYRIIVRTSELRTLRASILEEAFPWPARHGPQRGLPPKKLLEYLVPGLNTQCLRLASSSPKVPEMLLKLDEQGLTFQRKVGVMYCKAGQSTEEEMYNNEIAGPAFAEFLDLLGQRVKLKGFEKYRAQLDNKTDSTGTHSLYTTYQEYEIMFHVSTMLPYTANNSQQLLRKRHIGNDIVTIVFQEPGAGPFTPKTIRSHFQHVFLVVQVHDPCTERVSYSVAITCSKDIPEFGPFFPKDAAFPGSPTFREFLLAKVVNGENAAEKSEKFHAMATRTRQEYLKELADNHVTTGTVDSSSSSKLAAIISLPTKRKERPRGGRAPELHSAGALVWPVAADWTQAPGEADAILGISNEFVVVLDRRQQRAVLNCSCRDVIGWTLSRGKRVVIYYEQGEFVDITTLDNQPDDFTEIVHRLEMVTTGCVTEDLVLRRNSVHHLGFQVNGDGIVTQVEENGYAQMTGLKLFSRLVRICEIPMVTMSYSKRTEILRKADHVRITIIPPDSKGKPRMSFSELYRKSIEETERKCERVADLGLAAPCLLLSRMSSLQETRSASPHGQQSPTVRSCSLEMRVAQGQRNERDPCSRPLKTSTPDLILAVSSQCPVSPGRLEFDSNDGQVAAPRCSAPEQGRPGDPSACGPGPRPPLGGATPVSTLAAAPSQSAPSGANLHDIMASDVSNIQWESLTDIALYCENLVRSLSLEEEKTTEEPSRADGQREENRSSISPTVLNEKVFHLESVVKQLNDKLKQEKEDKAQLTTEMEQLRQTNQRLHQESQSTVCRLLRVTELLIHNGNPKAPGLHN